MARVGTDRLGNVDGSSGDVGAGVVRFGRTDRHFDSRTYVGLLGRVARGVAARSFDGVAVAFFLGFLEAWLDASPVFTLGHVDRARIGLRTTVVVDNSVLGGVRP